ncbi:hypothetical protein CJ255_12585 [Candidatus Viridilinea mediisalina]|uniref:Uncharacterized protein n=1 Tax=Candidatus Viridilinea mediisalina TaxID=2024553 RepID=A0A2A6RIH8_9CHLR|nr:hypothetical protein CJ255_12585 [Candidatus Viridilinea mediisalina]
MVAARAPPARSEGLLLVQGEGTAIFLRSFALLCALYEKLSEKPGGTRWSAGFSRLKPALQRQTIDFSDSL